METFEVDVATKHWSATELRKLPEAERGAILRAQAELAEPFYRNDPDLTAFEAFDGESMDGKAESTKS